MMTAARICAVAAAAAHDFNEVLAIMLSALEMVEQDAALNPELRITANQAKLAGYRSAWQVGRLLDFTQRNGARPSAVTMERLVKHLESQ